ncbi:MAG: J domain-containing protein [Deltaproteobacteria bacterium]|jgi:hypothetical protein|nr:J domain-containing protein [Deltaproteobacteria bacterium]
MKKSVSHSLPRNPFEIFGLTPTLVGELSEKDLVNVLKGMYRNLQKAFHPDTGGDRGVDGRNRAVELNLAFEALDLDRNLVAFRQHRKNYLLTHPSNARNNTLILRDRLKNQAAREEKLADVFFSYLLHAADETQLGALAQLGARNVLLGLQDVAIKNNVRHASWLLGSNYKNIEINSDGALRTRAVGRRHFCASNNTVLLGCVPKDTVNITPLLERCAPSRIFKSPAITDYDPDALPQVTVRNLINQDNFKKYLLSSLKPILMESAYLFSLNRHEFSSSGLISLEGVIVKMETLEKQSSAL